MNTRTPEHRPRQGWQPVAERAPSQYLYSLEEEATRDLVGGKAHGLMLANRAGFSVPQGFVISTAAFDTMVDLAVPMAHSTDELREALRVEPLPARLLAEIEEATNGGAGKWAVRSSAFDEDGRRSFAGQQTTVLNVTGIDAIIDAVREVWASLYDPMALMYRARLALDGLPGSMGVVVQKMVSPRVAGVVFSRNPVALELPELIVSAAPGLGTVVVDGDACDTYYLERPSGYLLRSELVGSGVLTSSELEKLANLSLRTEGLLASDGPIPGADVEWAIDGDTIYVLQARQITGHRGDATDDVVWSNANVGEALPGVATPMTWSVLKDFSTLGFERAFGALGLDVPEDAELVGSFHGRIYLNLTEFVSIASAIPILDPTMLYSVAGGGAASLVKNITRRSSTSFISRLPTTIPRILTTQASMPMVAKIWETYFDRQCEQFFERELYRKSHRAMLDELQNLDRLFNMTGQVMLSVSSNFLMSYVLTSEFLTWFGSEEAHGREKDLLTDLGVKSAEPGQHLLELGRIARRSKRLRRIIGDNPSDQVLGLLLQENQHDDVRHFLDKLDEFRLQFGHRAPREAELATPRWRENLSFAFDVLKGILNSSHVASPREVERNREENAKSASQLIDRTFAPGISTAFRGVLQVTRLNARLRESTRARVVDALDMYRHFLLECGRRMVQTGVLHKTEDIFFLKKPEVQAWLSDITVGRGFKRRVIVRRAVFEAFEQMPDPPATFVMRGDERINQDPQAPNDLGSDEDQHFTGLPASSGRVTGRARVITSSKDAVMEPDEILVVPYADVGWTPLFVGAKAVVMGLGGPLSHAAIVAREFHIPAVVSVPGICELIQTGDTITVDGDRGTVTRRR